MMKQFGGGIGHDLPDRNAQNVAPDGKLVQIDGLFTALDFAQMRYGEINALRVHAPVSSPSALLRGEPGERLREVRLADAVSAVLEQVEQILVRGRAFRLSGDLPDEDAAH